MKVDCVDINGITWKRGDRVEMIETGLKGEVVSICAGCPRPLSVLWENGSRRPMRAKLIRKI